MTTVDEVMNQIAQYGLLVFKAGRGDHDARDKSDAAYPKLRAALEAMAGGREAGNVWRDAVQNAMVANCLDWTDDESPRSVVERLIAYENKLALDPSVCSDAQALIDRGRAEGEADRRDAESWRFLRDRAPCSLTIERNAFATSYMTAAKRIDEQDGVFYFADTPPDEIERMKAENVIWTIHVYPNTPVGFDVYHAATLDGALTQWRSDIDTAIASQQERAG